jgi:hypothetical protein
VLHQAGLLNGPLQLERGITWFVEIKLKHVLIIPFLDIQKSGHVRSPVAISTGRRNTLIKSLCWCCKV